MLGTTEGAIVAMVMERGKPAVWAINWDSKFLAAVYSVSEPYFVDLPFLHASCIQPYGLVIIIEIFYLI